MGPNGWDIGIQGGTGNLMAEFSDEELRPPRDQPRTVPRHSPQLLRSVSWFCVAAMTTLRKTGRTNPQCKVTPFNVLNPAIFRKRP